MRGDSNVVPVQAIDQMTMILQQKLREFEEWCVTRRVDIQHQRVPTIQKRCGRQRQFFATNPFPWITNLGNTCYISSVVRCLFHCYSVRRCLEDDASEIGIQNVALRRLLKQLLHS